MTAAFADDLPLVVAAPAALSAVEVFRRLAALPHVVFFDSALRREDVGRYSFIAADPFAWIEAPSDGSPGLDWVEAAIAPFTAESRPDLPPFQGGAAGLLGYDLGRSLEHYPRARYDEYGEPALAMGLYDVVVAIDHVADRVWFISQGFPETELVSRRRLAKERLERVLAVLNAPVAAPWNGSRGAQPSSGRAPRYATRAGGEVVSNFGETDYLAAVARNVEYIYAGDVFQVNLSQRLTAPRRLAPIDGYLRLRVINPAPFAGYFDWGGGQVLSSSPERFVVVRDRCVETRPIKGTRPRGATPAEDEQLAAELLSNEKDRAENTMIVDLLRNDLSRVCTAPSVVVPTLCGLERYAHVQHLVSVARGELAADASPWRLLRGAFPGGSITGAPKIRAMEIIAELEPTCRGAYCGSLAYVGFDGAMDTSILIRTLVAAGQEWSACVGGGIVAQSEPRTEYDETWHKARGLVEVLAAT